MNTAHRSGGGPAELPSSLTPWAPFLAALTPRLAVALGPLIRRMDGLLAASGAVSAVRGDFSGYGGITHRGRPELLLASEWLLADMFEEEFLRRAANGELLHLAREFDERRVGGTVHAVMDAGPYAAGAGRLVQLAGIVVLGRRAEARGADLVVRVLGRDAGQALRGSAFAVLSKWLESRRERPPGAEEVAEALEGLGERDEAWVFGSPRLAGCVPAPARLVTAEDGRWSAAGAASVRVAVGASPPVDLPLPERELALRTLRGGEFRRRAAGGSSAEMATPVAVVAAPGAVPAFTGATSHLILRGRTPGEVVSVFVPSAVGQQAGRVKRHVFPGTVVGASWIGRRLVAVCLAEDRLRVHVEGRPWSRLPVDLLGGPVHRLAVRPEFATEPAGLPPAPVLLFDHGFVTRLDDTWVHVARHEVVPTPWAAVAPGPVLDRPLRTTVSGGGELLAEGWRQSFRASGVRDHLIGAHAVATRSDDPALWRVLAEGGEPVGELRVGADARPVGLVVDGSVPYLVTVSGSGAVTVCSPSGKRVFGGASASGGVAVHPTLPLWAARDAVGAVRVRHVVTGDEVLALREDA
ncbi:hypothetical protein OG216_06095 [Streptomycetaceae bacterium NBC_01309]